VIPDVTAVKVEMECKSSRYLALLPGLFVGENGESIFGFNRAQNAIYLTGKCGDPSKM
jgi:hypothetical protein